MYGVFDPCYPDFPQREQDIEQAMALLAEAGQENLTIDLFAPDDTAGLADLIAVFADQASAAGVTVNAQVLDGATYWGDEYTKRTFATSFWGTRPYLNQVAAGSLSTATYPETHWPPEGSDFEAKYFEALAETDDDARCALIEEMQQAEFDEGGNLIPFFNNLIDATAANVQGFVARPNVLNLDHYGRGLQEHLARRLRVAGDGHRQVHRQEAPVRRAHAVHRVRRRLPAHPGAVRPGQGDPRTRGDARVGARQAAGARPRPADRHAVLGLVQRAADG